MNNETVLPVVVDECTLIVRILAVESGGRTTPLRGNVLGALPDVPDDRLSEAVDRLHVSPGHLTVVRVRKRLESATGLARGFVHGVWDLDGLSFAVDFQFTDARVPAENIEGTFHLKDEK